MNRAELERVRIEGNAALQQQRVESAASIASAHKEWIKTAEAAAQAQFEEAERIRTKSETALQARIAEAEQKQNAAEQAGDDLSKRLEQIGNENAQAIEALKQESSAKEALARQEERILTEASSKNALSSPSG